MVNNCNSLHKSNVFCRDWLFIILPNLRGHSFYEVNKELLDMYASCKDGAECVSKQMEFLKKEKEERLNPKIDG